MPLRFVCLGLLIAMNGVGAAEPSAADIDHFEKSVRPILVEHCYKCHSAETKNPKGNLRVDGRAHLMVGGDNGPSVVPGSPEKSRLIEAVKYGNPDLLMPPKAKLSDVQIRELERWVKAGRASVAKGGERGRGGRGTISIWPSAKPSIGYMEADCEADAAGREKASPCRCLSERRNWPR